MISSRFHATSLWHLALTLIPVFFLVSCSLVNNRPPMAQEVQTGIERDTSCSYFYFLWGTHEEYNRNYQEALEAYRKALICDPSADYVNQKIPELHLKMGETEKAVDILIHELDANPTDISTRMLLAKIYIHQKNSDDAINQYRKILEIDPANIQSLLRLGILLIQNGSLEEAETLLLKLQDIDPDSYLAHIYLGRISASTGKTAEAESRYIRALDLNWSSDLVSEISEYYMKNQEFQKNLEFLQLQLKHDENDQTIRLFLVRTLLALGREEEAIAELGTFQGIADNPIDISLNLSRLYIRNGDTEKALMNIEALLSEKEVSEARYLQGVLYLDIKEFDKAQASLSKITAGSKEFEDAVLMRSSILKQENMTEEAITMLKAYIAEEKSRKPKFFAAVSSLLRDEKRNDEALLILENGITFFPGSERLIFEYGLQLERMERLEEAIATMQTIIDKNPEHAEALNFIGYSWADTDRNLDKAREYIIKAIRLKPDNGYIQDSLGWVYYKLGDYERAKTELLRAIRLVNDDPYIHEHLGDVYLALNNPRKALDHYNYAFELYENEKRKTLVREKIDKLTVH